MSWILVLVALAIVVGVLVTLRRWRLPGSSAPPLPDLPPGEPGEALRRGAGPPPPQEPTGLRAAMARTREAFRAIFVRSALDEATWADLEEALLRADVGATMTAALLAELRAELPSDATPADARVLLRARVAARMASITTAMAPRPAEGPYVVLVVGVNGSGKTTSIGKLAARWTGEGHRVVLGAADTFRAGAIEQLRTWAERAGVDIVAHQEGADPGAVCHDTLQAARARGHDTVLCDTAGRLQAHKQLMDELAKVRRVLGKGVPGAPHEVLLVLDATMGQNALSQARLFQEVAGVTGIVLTKLDGTARGGVVLAIAAETGLPVKWVGVGERAEDLRPFDAAAFVEAWFADAG